MGESSLERAACATSADRSADDREELVFPAPGMCFGCSPANAAGLRLRFFRDGVGVLCETEIPPAYQGALGVVHGGIQAVLLDEVSCAAAFFIASSYVVTGELAIRYRRPCPVGEPLRVCATVMADAGRYLTVRADIRTRADADVLTSAEGKFYRDRRRNGP
jgi:acyl-coenzyme A thioesterase PaaI-like protein